MKQVVDCHHVQKKTVPLEGGGLKITRYNANTSVTNPVIYPGKDQSSIFCQIWKKKSKTRGVEFMKHSKGKILLKQEKRLVESWPVV